jgi:Uma2 family endonuclease
MRDQTPTIQHGQQMTLAEFQQLPEATQPLELINGALIVSPTPKEPHQRTTNRIERLLEDLGPQGQMRHAPFDVYIGGHAVQPDVFWIGPDSRCVLQADGYWHGPPDLVVEILSPSTALRDRREKLAIYAEHGVREYWLVDPANLTLEVHIQQAETVPGSFAPAGVYGRGETFESGVLGATVPLDAVFGGA